MLIIDSYYLGTSFRILVNTGSPRLAWVTQNATLCPLKASLRIWPPSTKLFTTTQFSLKQYQGGAEVSLNNITFWVRCILFKRDVGSACLDWVRPQLPSFWRAGIKFSLEQRTNCAHTSTMERCWEGQRGVAKSGGCQELYLRQSNCRVWQHLDFRVWDYRVWLHPNCREGLHQVELSTGEVTPVTLVCNYR